LLCCEAHGHTVEYQPAHVAARSFPSTVEALRAYDCVMLSDVGANTLLLHLETFLKSIARPNRLQVIHDYVHGGGGLVMIGGYMTFQGIEGKARYQGSPVEAVLPVLMSTGDDRVEAPQGLVPRAEMAAHAMLEGITGDWPALLGLNAVKAAPGADTVVSAGGYPLLLAGQFGEGRGVAFTSDCAPHWAPPEFVAWEHYGRLWNQIVTWAAAT